MLGNYSFILQLVSYQPNLGLKYGYLLPNDIEKQIAPPSIRVPNRSVPPHDGRQLAPPSVLIPRSHTIETPNLDRSLHSNQQDDPKSLTSHHHHRQRRVRKRFTWKISGISACSKSCGGGELNFVDNLIVNHCIKIFIFGS